MAQRPHDTVSDLNIQLNRSAFAFRGYNVTNLGRTPELWQIAAYRPALERWLEVGSEVCNAVYGGSTDLAKRVVEQLEADLDHYAEAVAMVMAVEFAQLEILRDVHSVEYEKAKVSFGFSLGELTAIAANRMCSPREAMHVPVTLAKDCALLAQDTKLGIVFSRAVAVDEQAMVRLCEDITSERSGVIGISAVLSPNTYLVLGQKDTLERFRSRMHGVLPESTHLKLDPNHWPPLHTPIVRQRHIPDRASVLMESMTHVAGIDRPTVFSLATGAPSYASQPTREILRRWVDHPQRLWDAVSYTLKEDVQVVIHVGPGPNVIPATFHRLSENVRQQLARISLAGFGMRAMSGLAHRRWLANLLPQRASLLRAPGLKQVILEDWLLEHAPR